MPLAQNRRDPVAEPFARSPAPGALLRPGPRVAVAPLEFFHSLHATLATAFPDDATVLLYRAGYECALRELRAADERAGTEPNDRAARPDFRSALAQWWQPWRDGGWGAGTFDTTAVARHVLVVTLSGSPCARVGAAGDFHAGLFAGAFSVFERAERHAVGLGREAEGAEVFLAGPGADVDAVQSWRQKGDGVADILRRFR